MNEPAQRPIALLGTGIMGRGMAGQLLAQGFSLRVWNRTARKAAELAEKGATVADTPREAADGAGAVITMVSDGDAVRQVMTGPEGALAGMADDAVWLQMATVGIAHTTALKALADSHQIPFVDAPVLGTRKPAEEGNLLVLGSGPDSIREACQPIFDAVGKKTIWLGEAGEASKLKLVANNWVVGLLAVLAETLSLAEHLGVEPQVFLDTIRGGALDVGYAHIKGRAMIERHFPASFPLRLALKDARLIAAAGKDEGLRMKVTDAVAEHFVRALEQGHGDDDMAAILLGVEAG
jgi:3-hydroxyisobutyrate dehydrogenase